MTAREFLKDKVLIVIANGMGIFFLSLYLLAVGNSQTTVILVALVWLAVFTALLIFGYRNRKHYFDQIENLMRQLDQPYLIQEFLGSSWKQEDQLYKEILHRSNKAVIERISQLENAQKEYREFIEGWIHEVKLPITGLWLACHNEKQSESLRIENYLTEIENAVDQALFYARSDQVYKDYQVTDVDMRQIVMKVVKKNKHLLIQNRMKVQVECSAADIMSDRKWLEFILAQILMNAVKYKKEGSGEIVFSSQETKDAVKLSIRDAGIGVPAAEVGRIFEKSFTGSNGRNREKSTGIGLYLCHKLCRKLEIEIGVDSIENQYTEIYLIFPRNSYLTKL